jgi:CHAD domain-containing protein
MPLLGQPRQSNRVDDVTVAFKRLGRSLGRVRDVDVRIALLAALEGRIPHAAPTLVLIRQEHERTRLELARELIKRLERLDTIRVIQSLLARRRPRVVPWLPALPRNRHWERHLHDTVAARAHAAQDAIVHATGVYFPKRTHAARIAIKKLRYAVEIVDEAGLADCAAAIRELKKAQDVLGELHDYQELGTSLQAEGSNAHGDQVPVIRQVVEAAASQLHTRYLERREPVLAVCRSAGEAAAPRRPATPALLAAGALALSSSAYVAHRIRGESNSR